MSSLFETLQSTGKEQVEKSLAAYGAITKTVQALSADAGAYAQKSFEDGAVAWQELLGAKTLDRAIEIQSGWAKASYEAFVAQATKFGDAAVDLGKEAMKPLEGVVPVAK